MVAGFLIDDEEDFELRWYFKCRERKVLLCRQACLQSVCRLYVSVERDLCSQARTAAGTETYYGRAVTARPSRG